MCRAFPPESSRIPITLICDDIRQEVGGKQSLMGLYNDAIIFEANPFVINAPARAFKTFTGAGSIRIEQR